MLETQVRSLSWEVGHDLATKPSPPGRREQRHGERLSFTKHSAAAAAAKSLQSRLTLCDPIDGSPPGSSIHGILQARTLEWVAISFSNAQK